MDDPADIALNHLKDIEREFATFIAEKGKASESDTRVKLIDRVLKEVCSSPSSELSREEHVESGYTDYQLRVRRQPFCIVEAKREGLSFVFTIGAGSRSPTLDGAIVTDPEIRQAINQVRQYCDDIGAKFAIATNGYAWVAFRAIRDDMPWKKGRARVSFYRVHPRSLRGILESTVI